MMTIDKVGIVGAGTMGAGIAKLLAQKNIAVLLLDIHTPTLPDPELASFIRVGNIQDDFDDLAMCDWVVEVIVERLQPKRDLMTRLEATCKPEAIISSNTSGIPIGDIVADCSADFKKRFLGTHFFNPPTHMKLLEIIPTDDTDPEITKQMTTFGTQTLEKGVVRCKDTPNFIANRIGTLTSAYAMQQALASGFPVAKIDLLLGEFIGRPKTGLCRLGDLIGLDIRVGIMRNLYPNIPHDSYRHILHDETVLAFYDYMLANNLRGNKDGHGFYDKRILVDGSREYWTLNLNTYAYQPPQQVDLGALEHYIAIAALPERLQAALHDDSPEGAFVRNITYNLLTYAAYIAPEAAYALDDIDNAVRWGFNHQMGPFELWDSLGVSATVDHMQAYDFRVPDWVLAMLNAGRSSFYEGHTIYNLS